jgi:hypothetical protein
MVCVDEDFRDEHDDEKKEEREDPDGFSNDRDYWLWKQG